MGESELYLVTGATGFIGRYVVRALLQRGARVRIFCRDATKASRLFANHSEIVRGDLTDAVSVSTACRGVSSVVHIGGLYRFGRRWQQALMAANVRGTENVLAASRTAGVRRVVHCSSNAVLENDSTAVTERDFPAHVPRREFYRWSKWQSDCVALAAARDGLPVMIANLASPLGPEDETPTPTGRIVQDFLADRFPFASRTALNFIDVRDLAAGILAVAERGRPGERYLLGHHNIWFSDFLRLVARYSGGTAPRCCLPLPLIRAAGAVGEFFGNERVCWETAAHAARRQWLDCTKARTELGWEPAAALDTLVQETVTWFVRQRSAAPLTALPAPSN